MHAADAPNRGALKVDAIRLADSHAAAQDAGEPHELVEGRVLGDRYRVGPMVGSGAMGRVYSAHHIALGRSCAIKVVRVPADVVDWEREQALEEAIARFRVEALAASRLDHPNVLSVLDFGRAPEDGLYYLVTEHLDGRDLVDMLAAEAPLSTARIVGIGRQICAALAHAHDRGVVHRDVKPENVRLVERAGDDGVVHEHVKLFDFGTAIVKGDDAEREELVIGTPAYMSPEQALGEEVDGRSDVYSCGVLLFELATGRLPFERPTEVAVAAAHVECPPPPPSLYRPDIDLELESIILWCLEKRADARPQSARALRAALDGVLRSQPIERASETAEPMSEPAAIRRTSAPPATARPISSGLKTAPQSAPSSYATPVARTVPPEAPRSRRARAVAATIAAIVALGLLMVRFPDGSARAVHAAAPSPALAYRVGDETFPPPTDADFERELSQTAGAPRLSEAESQASPPAPALASRPGKPRANGARARDESTSRLSVEGASSSVSAASEESDPLLSR